MVIRRCLVTSIVLAMAMLVVVAASVDASATGGSWGSSRGGFASGGGSWGGGGGSWGSGGSSGGGLLGGRRPIRNLLSRIGSRIGNLGSRGGSSGGSFGSGGWGSNGGGSTGYVGAGSSGGGSTGGYYGGGLSIASPTYASVDSFGSTGGLYSGTATENYYGDWGSSYLAAPAVVGAPIETAPIVGTPIIGAYDTAMGVGMASPAYDSVESVYGSGMLDSGIPYTSPMAIETDYVAPVLDYGSFPANENMSDPSVVSPRSGDVFGPVDSSQGSGFGDGLPDAPIPDADAMDTDNDSTSSDLKTKNEAVLSLELAEDAKVFVNGKLTKTSGKVREYVSRNLTKDKPYHYRVKAVVVRNGQEIVRTKLVSMRPGKVTRARFQFDQPPVTTLVLKVPRDAKVILDGRETKARGTVRTFSTTKLSNEQSWKDYPVEVRYEVDGETVVKKQQVNLQAGLRRTIAFDDEATGQLAQN